MPLTRRRFLAITAGAFLARMGSADAMPTTETPLVTPPQRITSCTAPPDRIPAG
jgi:hypothetical protein